MEYAFSLTHPRMSIRFALCLTALLPACSCTARPATFDAIAEGYVRASLKLAQHDPSLVEDWRGPESWRPGPRQPVAQLQDEISELERQLAVVRYDISSGQEHARGQYLAAQVRALGFAAERQLGRAASIDDQARDEFAVAFPPLDQAAMTRTHDALNRLLPGDQPLAARMEGLRRSTIVPTDNRGHVIGLSLDACRQPTAVVIELPKDERVRGLFRSGMEWDAFARYAGDRVTDLEINNDVTLDVSRAFRIACHEGYPGHHVQHVLIDRLFEQRRWPELQLVPGFGPHLLLLEGAAEVGADLALSPSQREQFYRDQLFPAAGLKADRVNTLIQVEGHLQDLLPVVTDVARQYLGGSVTQERAVERLANDALVANPQGTLAFIERRRARALVYGEGRRVIYGLMKTRDLAGLYAAFRSAAAVQ
jgi:hypothetical protein